MLNLKPNRRTLAGFVLAAALVALVIGLTQLANIENASGIATMVMILPVVASALYAGIGPGLFAAVLGFCATNFFLVAPQWTFEISRPEDLLALVVFLVVGALVGTMTGQLRLQRAAVDGHAAHVNKLADFAGSLALSGEPVHMAESLAVFLTELTGEGVVLCPDGENLAVTIAEPGKMALSATELDAAHWAYAAREPAGNATGIIGEARLQFRPINVGRVVFGVAGFVPGRPEAFPHLSAMLVDQTAAAMDRLSQATDTARASARAEAEALRAMLLSGLSHDLRTPLSATLGAVTTLRTLRAQLPDEAQDDLLATIEEETRRLSEFVSSLLEITRLEQKEPDLARDWIDLSEIVGEAAATMQASAPDMPLECIRPESNLVVRGRAVLLRQVVLNLLDNARKYAPGPVRLLLISTPEHAEIRVEDRGEGIPEEELERIFEKFHRVADDDRVPAGFGLGLSICRSVVSAMGGTIHAESPLASGHGTRMVIRLPLTPLLPNPAPAGQGDAA